VRILILGGDGYLGWPTAMYFSDQGHEVCVVDNFAKRHWEADIGVTPLWPIPSLNRRVRVWKKVSGHEIQHRVGDIASDNYFFLEQTFKGFRPEAIIHYAEQPSAPYSMASRRRSVLTQVNNVVGTLNVLWAIREFAPDAHLVKLGTMGEYGTPNIDIEEGWLDIEHKGRKDRVLFPKRAGSWYHLSKVHDSHNIEFACRIWGLRVTDLNQGVVYGINTSEIELHPELLTSFHYDQVFGTALNRFCVQAVAGIPLTVYGKGGQKRGFLNIRDTLRCVELAILNPAGEGEFRVFNQFTEVFSIKDLAGIVKKAAEEFGFEVRVDLVPNPRVESEDHYYNPRNDSLLKLGLRPILISNELVFNMLRKIKAGVELIDQEIILPTINWR